MPDQAPVTSDHPRSVISLDRLFILCRAHGTPLVFDYAPGVDPFQQPIKEVYVRVGGIGVGWFDGDGLELSGALAEWIGRLERRAVERDV
jgi:hypothetical protein